MHKTTCNASSVIFNRKLQTIQILLCDPVCKIMNGIHTIFCWLYVFEDVKNVCKFPSLFKRKKNSDYHVYHIYYIHKNISKFTKFCDLQNAFFSLCQCCLGWTTLGQNH